MNGWKNDSITPLTIGKNLGLWIWLFGLKCRIGTKSDFSKPPHSTRIPYMGVGISSASPAASDSSGLSSSWALRPLVGKAGKAW